MGGSSKEMQTNKPGQIIGLVLHIVGLGSKVRPFLALAFSSRPAGQVGFSATSAVCTGVAIIGWP